MTIDTDYLVRCEQLLAKISNTENAKYLLEAIREKINNKNSKLFFEKLANLTFDKLRDVNFNNSVVSAKNNNQNFDEYETIIKSLSPWRKGPFKLNSLFLDSEWQCQLKWDRLSKKIEFKNKNVLDVGTGNGYYLYRLLGADVDLCIGMDPHLLYFHQGLALNKFFQSLEFHHLPIGWECCDKLIPKFDIVMCMGVLYHQKKPEDLLRFLKKPLQNSGELVLETLIIDSKEDTELIPKGRYAAMKNVYSLPSKKRLIKWLKNTGYRKIEILNINQTEPQEQRQTVFSSGMSLIDFLDSNDLSNTIEGHPRPLRILIKALK